MIEINTIAANIFDKLRSRFDRVSLGAEDLSKTVNPEEARFFNFDFANDDGKKVCNVTINITEDKSILVYFNKDIRKKMLPDTKSKWYSFLRNIRKFAKRHLCSFDIKDIDKSGLEMKDLKHLTKDDSVLDKNELSESRMYGTSRSSYENIGPTKIIVRHSKQVDENIVGSRTRNVSSIFIENHLGERFRLPENTSVSEARAYARHVKNGGRIDDDFGNHITEIINEMHSLKVFVRNMRGKTFEDADTNTMIESAVNYYGTLHKNLHSLKGQRGYTRYVENWQPEEKILTDEVNLEELRSRFERRIFDDRLTSALPIVAKAHKKLKSHQELEFESWISEVAGEFDESVDVIEDVDIEIDDNKKVFDIDDDSNYDRLKNIYKDEAKLNKGNIRDRLKKAMEETTIMESTNIENIKKQILHLEDVLDDITRSRNELGKITSEIKYDRTAEDIMSRVAKFVEPFRKYIDDLDYDDAFNNVSDAKENLQSNIFGLDQLLKYAEYRVISDIDNLQSEIDYPDELLSESTRQKKIDEIYKPTVQSYLDKTVDPVYGMPKHGMSHRMSGIKRASDRITGKKAMNPPRQRQWNDDDFYAYDPKTMRVKSSWTHKDVGRRHSEYVAQQNGWKVVNGMKAKHMGLYESDAIDSPGEVVAMIDGVRSTRDYNDAYHAFNSIKKLVSYGKAKVAELYIDGNKVKHVELNKRYDDFEPKRLEEGMKSVLNPQFRDTSMTEGSYQGQYKTKEEAIAYAKERVATFRDPDDGIEIWALPSGWFDVVHTMNSNGRNHVIKNGGKHLGTIKQKSGNVAEDGNPNAINSSRKQMIPSGKKIVKKDGIELDVSIDGASVDIRAMSQGKQLGYVIFNRDGNTIVADDLAIDEKYKGQGIAKVMYDYVKELGFTVKRSSDQTSAGRSFWDKNKGQDGQLWEQGSLNDQNKKFVVTYHNDLSDDTRTVLVTAADEYDAKDTIGYSLGRGSYITDVRMAKANDLTTTDDVYSSGRNTTTGQSSSGIYPRNQDMSEGTGVTDYNPKSQGGTRKELLAKYHKSKDPKDAEAARKAGATQKELQGIHENLDIPGSDKMSNSERDAAIKKKYPGAKQVGKTPGGYSSQGGSKADLVSNFRGVKKIKEESDNTPTIGINVRSDGDIDYASLIVDGKKKYESRKTDSLRPYVGKTVGIVRTGSGQAVAIGQVTIGEPIVADVEKFNSLRKQHLVPKGSKFDIDDGGTKYLYPMINPVRWDNERLLKHRGIVSRKIQEQGLEENSKNILPTGTLVTVPHNGKKVTGKIVRYDDGKGIYSPAYVVDIGEYESIFVLASKLHQNQRVELDEISSKMVGDYYSAATKKHINKVGIKPNMYDRIEKDMGKQRKAGIDRALDRIIGDRKTNEEENFADGRKFVEPNFDFEWEEAERYPEFVKLGKDAWIELAKKGRAVVITSARGINNTDAADPDNFKSLVPEKQKRALAQLETGTVEMPIVAVYSDGRKELVGGNTRLTAMMARDGQATVWAFRVPGQQGVAEGNKGISKKQETKFHAKLDKLVHDTFGRRKDEMEESLKTENPCWTGYKPVGTKKKNGKTVPNCVPKDKVDESPAAKMRMDDAIKVLNRYGASGFKTRSNDLDFYKIGNPFHLDLTWDKRGHRYVDVAHLNAIVRKLRDINLKVNDLVESVDSSYKGIGRVINIDGDAVTISTEHGVYPVLTNRLKLLSIDSIQETKQSTKPTRSNLLINKLLEQYDEVDLDTADNAVDNDQGEGGDWGKLFTKHGINFSYRDNTYILDNADEVKRAKDWIAKTDSKAQFPEFRIKRSDTDHASTAFGGGQEKSTVKEDINFLKRLSGL